VSVSSSHSLKVGLQHFGVIDGMHIPLSAKPNKQIISSITNFYNIKCFHSIKIQVVCDYDMVFWNACVGQLGGVVDGGQFRMSSLYFFFQSKQILQELLIIIEGVQIQPYLLGYVAYPIQPYLLKGYKP
jgi:hypothetical protein